MKGEPRKQKALERQIRALAAQIPDEDALNDVAALVPAHKRGGFIRSITPLLKFKLSA